MLYECHGHIMLDGLSYQDSYAHHQSGPNQAFVRQNLKTCAAAGIKYYRDGGDKLGVSSLAKKLAHEYGIDYRTPVCIIHKQGFYGSMFGHSFETVREYRALIRAIRRDGADFVKLTVTGMLDFMHEGIPTGPSMPFSELRELVEIAHGEGFAVMAHCNGAAHIKTALGAGVDSLEHGFLPDDETVRYFLETGAVWVPTSSTVRNLIGCGRYDDGLLGKILDEQKQVLMQAYAAGVSIASGSDCGAHLVPQGRGTLDEYSWLTELGIDPEKGNKQICALFRAR